MATRDIKTRFVLEGEQSYKRAMSDAASAIKVLNSEQRLAKAEFEATGDAQQYAADQARILKEKIEQQKRAVEAAETALKNLTKNGIDKNTRQTQTWQRKLNDAKRDLLLMQTELNGVSDKMTAVQNGSDEQLGKISKGIDLQNTINAIDNVTRHIETIIKTAAKAAKAVWDMGVDAGQWADNIATLANEAGVDPATYQSWQYASRFIDTSVDDIVKSWKDLDKHLNTDKTGDDFREFGSKMAKLGIGVMDASGKVKSGRTVFWQAIDALHNMGDETAWAASAMDLFGNDWRKLNPLITAGSKAYEDMANEGRAVAVVSNENVAALGAVDDAVQDMGARFDKLKYDTLAEMAPTFQKVAEALSTAITALNEFVQSEEGQAALASLNEALSGMIDSFLGEDNGKGTFKAIVDGASEAVRGFTGAMEWINEHGEAVRVAVVGLASAWAGLKVTKEVLEFAQLLSGAKRGVGGLFSRLFGGKSASAEGLNGVTSSFSDAADSFSSAADAANKASEAASSSATAAKSAADAASSSATAADSSSTSASSSATSAESSSTAAGSSAEASASSAEASASSATAAGNSSAAAAGSGEAAELSAGAAGSSAEAAGLSAGAAGQSQAAAAASADAALQSSAASGSASLAAGSSSEAARLSAGAAADSATGASYSAIAAGESSAAASLAAGTAGDAALAAGDASAAALASSDTALLSAGAAKSSASAAGSSSLAAGNSQAAAAASADAALLSEGAAGSAALTAGSSAEAAGLSASAASSSEISAAASADTALLSEGAASSSALAAGSSAEAAGLSEGAAAASADAAGYSDLSALSSASAAKSSAAAALSSAEAAATSVEAAASSAAAAAQSALGAAAAQASLESAVAGALEQAAAASVSRIKADAAAARALTAANSASLQYGMSMAKNLLGGAKGLTAGGSTPLGLPSGSTPSAALPPSIPSEFGTMTAGLAGLTMIGYGFEKAAEARQGDQTKLVDTAEHLIASTENNSELMKAFEEFVRTQAAQDNAFLNWDMTDDELNDIIDKANAASEAFHAIEGSGKVLDAYNSWRTGNAISDWILPENWEQIGLDATAGLTSGIDSGLADVEEAGQGIGNTLTEAVMASLDEHSPSKVFEIIGGNAAVGLANGIYGRGDEAIRAAQWLADSVTNIVQSALQIHSPSRVFERLGAFTGQGFAAGIESSAEAVSRAVGTMIGATTRRPAAAYGSVPVSLAGGAAGRAAGSYAGAGTVHVTMVLDDEVLGDVMAPIVNDKIGAKINATRR